MQGGGKPPKRDQYLAAHPIAGTEFSGQGGAQGLFSGKPQILCEAKSTRSDLLIWAKTAFRQMGMYLRFMDRKNFDRHMACVSHLSHISSFMLGKTVLEQEADEQNIFDLAGSGFESTVRLAKVLPKCGPQYLNKIKPMWSIFWAITLITYRISNANWKMISSMICINKWKIRIN